MVTLQRVRKVVGVLVLLVLLAAAGWALAARDELVLTALAGTGLLAGFVLSGRRSAPARR